METCSFKASSARFNCKGRLLLSFTERDEKYLLQRLLWCACWAKHFGYVPWRCFLINANVQLYRKWVVSKKVMWTFIAGWRVHAVLQRVTRNTDCSEFWGVPINWALVVCLCTVLNQARFIYLHGKRLISKNVVWAVNVGVSLHSVSRGATRTTTAASFAVCSWVEFLDCIPRRCFKSNANV